MKEHYKKLLRFQVNMISPALWPSKPENISEKNFWKVFLGICFASISLHTYVALTFPVFTKFDSKSYLVIMDELEKGQFKLEELPYHRTPGYPTFLLTIKRIFNNYFSIGLRLVQHFLGFISSMMVFLIAFYISRNLIFAAGATLAGFFSLETLLFYNFIMTEPLYTFLFISFLVTSIKAAILMNNRLFILALVIAAVIEYIRPAGMMLVAFLLTLWILRLVFTERKKCGDLQIFDFWKSLFSKIINVKFMMVLLGGLCLYFVVAAPVQLKTFIRAGPFYFQAKKAIPLWWRTVYSDRLPLPMEERVVQNFLKDYEVWKGKVKLGIEPASLALAHEPWQDEKMIQRFLNKKEGWRWHPMAITALRVERNWSYDRSVAFLGVMASKVFQENKQMYLKKLPLDLFSLLTKMPIWLPSGPFTNIYIWVASTSLYKGFYIILLFSGIFGGMFLFRRLEYVFLLSIIFYHIGIHAFVAPEMVRYRLPSSPFLAIIAFAGIWSLAILSFSLISRKIQKF